MKSIHRTGDFGIRCVCVTYLNVSPSRHHRDARKSIARRRWGERVLCPFPLPPHKGHIDHYLAPIPIHSSAFVRPSGISSYHTSESKKETNEGREGLGRRRNERVLPKGKPLSPAFAVPNSPTGVEKGHVGWVSTSARGHCIQPKLEGIPSTMG